jgi:hypothetical protein
MDETERDRDTEMTYQSEGEREREREKVCERGFFFTANKALASIFRQRSSRGEMARGSLGVKGPKP